MKTSKLERRGAKELFSACVVNGVLDENRIRQAVQLVITRKPRGFVSILSHLQRLVKLDLERRTARVESAIPLTPPEEAGVRASLTAKYGPGLEFIFAPNPDLIGGLRVQVGSDVYDGSLRARLQSLSETF